ncbi:MAG: N-acetylmuramoyl-L-alanine amidase [Clostridia bacterium]|nr:N-acetylmuramoyl-L-alanine amidase [Clostridia bacterium]
MNRFLKITALLLTILLLCGSFAGCAKKETSAQEDPSSPSEPAESTVESASSAPIAPESSSVIPESLPSVPPSLSPESPSVSEETPTESEDDDRDPDFDLRPTGVQTISKTPETLSEGSLVLVNKTYPYASTLTADLKNIKTDGNGIVAVSKFDHKLTKTTLQALESLTVAMKEETGTNKTFLVYSAFRDESYYENLAADPSYTGELAGESEHHTGLAVNVQFWDGAGSFNVGLEGVAGESGWLARNAHRFGFVQRYAQNKSSVTGKDAEPNHLRYVGIAHASYMFQKGLCLEEYLEAIKVYGPDNRLIVTDGNGYRWSVYYMPANVTGETTLFLPKGVVYELSGNNKDGFIVAVKSVWEEDLTTLVDQVRVSGVSVTPEQLAMTIGGSFTLNVSVTPENATNKALTFSSSNEKVVSVSPKGELHALSAGTAVITVSSVDGNLKASTQITVKEKGTTPIIWLDAGHGCDNADGVPDTGEGAGTPFFDVSGGFYEADLVMQVTSQVQALLKDKGYTVLLTRDGYRDDYVTLLDRAKEANAAGADIFLSLHTATDTSTKRGAKVYYYQDHLLAKESLALGNAISSAINKSGSSAATVTVTSSEQALLTHTNMASVSVELCHISNRKDAEQAITEQWCTAMAKALADGIIAQLEG